MKLRARFYGRAIPTAAVLIIATSTAPAASTQQHGADSSFSSVGAPESKPNESRGQPSPIDQRLSILEGRVSATQDSVNDTRNLVYILLSVLFATILALLGGVAWLESRIRSAAKRLNSIRDAAVATLQNCATEHIRDFQSYTDQVTQQHVGSRVVQDLVLAGKVLLWTGKYEDAVRTLDDAVRLTPNSVEARRVRGIALRRLGPGRSAEAIADLEVAASSAEFAEDAETQYHLAGAYLHTRRWDLAISQAQRLDESGYRNSEEVRVMVADALRGKGEAAEAERLYDDVIGQNPRCTPAILGKGTILTRQKRFDDLVRLYDSAISERAGVSKYHVYRALALARRDVAGDWEKAIEDFAAAERLSPSDWDLWYCRGTVHLDRALARAGTNLMKDDPLVMAAIQAFEQGVRSAKKLVTPKFRNQLCRIFLALGEEDKALREARKSVEANPAYIQNHMVLATTCLAVKRWPEAIAAAEAGLQHSDALPGRIWCNYFILYGRCFQRYDPPALRGSLDALLQDLDRAPYFDSSRWDFDHVEQVHVSDRLDLPEDVRSLLSDLKTALEAPESAQSVLDRWIRA